MTTLKPPLTGSVAVLTPSEMPLLKEHLLRLDPVSQRQRFNGAISEGFVEHYNTTYITDDTIVIGYIVGGQMRGAAELHPPNQHGSNPEIAFSVEKLFRSHGVGSELFERAIDEARKKGYDTVLITTNSNNERMKALARKYGVRMESRKGETVGTLKLKQQQAPVRRPIQTARFSNDCLSSAGSRTGNSPPISS